MKKSKRSFSLEENDFEPLQTADPNSGGDEEIIDLEDIIELPEESFDEDEDLSLEVEFLDAETGLSFEEKEEKEKPVDGLLHENDGQGIFPLLDFETGNDISMTPRTDNRLDEDALDGFFQDEDIPRQPSASAGFASEPTLEFSEKATEEEPSAGTVVNESPPGQSGPEWRTDDEDILDVDSEEDILRRLAEIESDAGDDDDLFVDDLYEEPPAEKPDRVKSAAATTTFSAAAAEAISFEEAASVALTAKASLTDHGNKGGGFISEEANSVPVPENLPDEPAAPEVPSLEELVSRIENNLMEMVKEIVEDKLPEIVRSILREEIERLEAESR